MNNRFRHIHLLLIVATIASGLSGCQNRKNGLFGSDNWGRNGYANQFLNSALNQNALSDGRVIGYIVYNQGSTLGLGGQPTNNIPNNPAGGVQPLNNPTGPNSGAGGIAGGTMNASQQTPCMLKILSGSTQFYPASNQSFGGQYHETYSPTSGQPFYAVGASLPITCGKDSEIAASATAFYVTGGSNNNNVWVYRMNRDGIPLGASPPIAVNAPTKISASSSGHIAVIADNGHSLVLMFEGRVGGDGGRIADIYRTIPAQNNAVYTDVVIDRAQGGIYVGMKLPGGAGRVLVMDIGAAFNGTYNNGVSVTNGFSNTAFDSFNPRSAYNFEHNLPNETSVDYLFRAAMPTKLKNNNGLTGIFTAAGHPFFMETGLGLNPEDTVGKTPQEMNDIYMRNADMKVQDIRVFDPFQIANHTNSSYVQPGYQFKDFAVGNNFAYLITERGTLYTIYVKSDSFDASTPIETHLPLGRLNTIEMSEDQKMAVVTGAAGLSIGRVSGNNIIFSSTGRPDVTENGEVIHAAILEKVYKKAVQQPVANATDAAKTSANTAAKPQ